MLRPRAVPWASVPQQVLTEAVPSPACRACRAGHEGGSLASSPGRAHFFSAKGAAGSSRPLPGQFPDTTIPWGWREERVRSAQPGPSVWGWSHVVTAQSQPQGTAQRRPSPSCRERPSASQAPSPPPCLPQRKSVGLWSHVWERPAAPWEGEELRPQQRAGPGWLGLISGAQEAELGPHRVGAGSAAGVLAGARWRLELGGRGPSTDTGRGRCSVCPWRAGRRVSSQWQGR